MKRTVLFIAMICLTISSAFAQIKKPSHQWFPDARFGMFIHFGPYSVLCDGEWVMETRPIKADNYKELQHFFNPQDFDAKAWVALAKEAGMKYIIFTSRHHDSFSNWDTKQSDWNIMNTPYGKDIVKQLADECHKEGIKIGLYYSLLDWMRDDYHFKTGRTGKNTGRAEEKDWMAYINFMKAQLTELLTNYGEISVIWFDGEWDQFPEDATSHDQSYKDWHLEEIYDLIHSLQPDCMISNNHHVNPLPGEDYQAFEKDLPGENQGGFSANQEATGALPLETCETINKTWGYSMTDNNFKSTKQLIHYLVRAAGYGANFLLNVGPMPNGVIPGESVERLKGMGQWTSAYGETIYGTTAGVTKPQTWGATTQKGNVHYIHILNKESDNLVIHFPKNVKSARWLNIDSDLKWKQDKKSKDVTFELNGSMDETDSIIEVILK
ncbi:MAG: alpha-L-fucosidase [Dysgonomonas sp.]|nr:alpha-L-fucosidase [Dysgonomonas sp.]